MSTSSKKVRFVDLPNIIEISPRKEKIPGKCAMPNEPPFSYSRLSFYNLLLHSGLLQYDLDAYNDFIEGKIGVYDLGINPDVVDDLMRSIKHQNMLDKWVKRENDHSDKLLSDNSEDEEYPSVIRNTAAIEISKDEIHNSGTEFPQLPTTSRSAIVVSWLLIDCDQYNGSRALETELPSTDLQQLRSKSMRRTTI